MGSSVYMQHLGDMFSSLNKEKTVKSLGRDALGVFCCLEAMPE
jgi:hypothetical protein